MLQRIDSTAPLIPQTWGFFKELGDTHSTTAFRYRKDTTNSPNHFFRKGREAAEPHGCCRCSKIVSA